MGLRVWAGRAALVAVFTAALGGVGIWWFQDSAETIVAELEQAAAVAESEQLPRQMERLRLQSALGESALVRLLASPRSEVVTAATEALHQQIDALEQSEPEIAEPAVRRLAAQLRGEIHRQGPSGQQSSAGLARRLVGLSYSWDSADVGPFLTDCEAVFATAAKQPSPERTDPPRPLEPATMVQPALLARAFRSDPQVAPTAFEELAALPGGELPLEPADFPELERPEPPRRHGEPPGLLPPLPAAAARPIADHYAGEDAEPPPKTRNAPSRHGLDADGEADVAPAARWQQWTDLEIAQRLHAPPETARLAEAALIARGYARGDVDILAQATSDEAVTRTAAADRCVALPSGRARAWLFHLAADSDAGVRKAAIQVLATSPSPQVRSFLSARLAQESTREVRTALENAIRN